MAAKKTGKTAVKKTGRASPKKTPAKPASATSPAGVIATEAMVPQGAQDLEDKDVRIRAFAHSFNTSEHLYVVQASNAPNPYFLRRPTGVIELDLDLGGGFPAGGCCFISGPDNSGKTWLMLRCMAWQQRLFGSACRLGYALTEGAFPYGQALNAGLRVYVPDGIIEQWQEWRRLRDMPPYTLEEIAVFQQPEVNDQLHILRGATGEDVLTIMLEAVRINAFSVLACDSLNGLQSAVDSEKELTKGEKVAAQATMINRFFKKYIPITTGFNNPNQTTVLFTQQVRANQERANAPSYMKAWIPEFVSSGGGWSAKHFKLIGLGLQDGKLIKKGEKDEKNKPVIGKMVSWFIEKGKAGTHDNKSGDVSYYYDIPGGVDEIGELVVSGLQRGVIQMRDKKVVVVRPEDKKVLDVFTAPTQRAFRRMLEVDFDLELALRREILSQANVPCLYR